MFSEHNMHVHLPRRWRMLCLALPSLSDAYSMHGAHRPNMVIPQAMAKALTGPATHAAKLANAQADLAAGSLTPPAAGCDSSVCSSAYEAAAELFACIMVCCM